MTNSYRFYVYRCSYCGTRTILTNDRYNPFSAIDNDDNSFDFKSTTCNHDIAWTCPSCVEIYLNRKCDE